MTLAYSSSRRSAEPDLESSAFDQATAMAASEVSSTVRKRDSRLRKTFSLMLQSSRHLRQTTRNPPHPRPPPSCLLYHRIRHGHLVSQHPSRTKCRYTICTRAASRISLPMRLLRRITSQRTCSQIVDLPTVRQTLEHKEPALLHTFAWASSVLISLAECSDVLLIRMQALFQFAMIRHTCSRQLTLRTSILVPVPILDS